MNHFPCDIERVVDGDTFVLGSAELGFHVRVGGLKVRIKDYSAPERRDVGGSAATQYADLLLKTQRGTAKIWIAPFEDRMTFERYVCDVWIEIPVKLLPHPRAITIGDRHALLFRELMVEQGHGRYTPFYQHEGRWAYDTRPHLQGNAMIEAERVFV